MLNDMMQALLPAVYPILRGDFNLSFAQIGMLTLVYQITGSRFGGEKGQSPSAPLFAASAAKERVRDGSRMAETPPYRRLGAQPESPAPKGDAPPECPVQPGGSDGIETATESEYVIGHSATPVGGHPTPGSASSGGLSFLAL